METEGMNLKEMIEKHIEEEKTDHEAYLSMAEAFEQHGYHEDAKIIRDIAREEGTHMNHLMIVKLHHMSE